MKALRSFVVQHCLPVTSRFVYEVSAYVCVLCRCYPTNQGVDMSIRHHTPGTRQSGGDLL